MSTSCMTSPTGTSTSVYAVSSTITAQTTSENIIPTTCNGRSSSIVRCQTSRMFTYTRSISQHTYTSTTSTDTSCTTTSDSASPPPTTSEAPVTLTTTSETTFTTQGPGATITSTLITYSSPSTSGASESTLPSVPFATTPGQNPSSSKRVYTSAILGGVVGGAITLILVGLAIWCILRRSRRKRRYEDAFDDLEFVSDDPVSTAELEPKPYVYDPRTGRENPAIGATASVHRGVSVMTSVSHAYSTPSHLTRGSTVYTNSETGWMYSPQTKRVSSFAGYGSKRESTAFPGGRRGRPTTAPSLSLSGFSSGHGHGGNSQYEDSRSESFHTAREELSSPGKVPPRRVEGGISDWGPPPPAYEVYEA